MADEVSRLGGPVIPVAAASLLDGALRRRGLTTRRQPVQLCGTGQGDFVATAGWWQQADSPVALAAAAAQGDPAAAAAAAEVVREWWSMRGARDVLLATPRSFCAGVERAIEIVERLLDNEGAPIFVRKEIVHNSYVVRELRQRGVVFVDELSQVPTGATAVFSAHGVSPAVRAEAAQRSLRVFDATCPLVTKVHNEAKRSAARGDTIVFIGHAGHEETEGTLGEAPAQMVLVQSVDDVDDVDVPDPHQVSYLTQTTLAVDETAAVVAALRRRFPDIREPKSDDICYATTNRQSALRDVAQHSDVVLVVGSPNSSNSLRLVELAQRCGTPAHLIDSAADIRAEWIRGTTTVGLTAGASAPPELVEDVVRALEGLGPVDVRETGSVVEDVHFGLPSKVLER